MNPDQVAERIGWIREVAARRGRSLDGFTISHRVYMGFAEKWKDTGGYVEGIMAPPAEIADYLNRFATIGVNEILITPLGNDPLFSESLEKFLDCFDAEVRPQLN
jgi:hypothetical protein